MIQVRKSQKQFFYLALILTKIFKMDPITGKSFSEALILALTNPKNYKRLFIELRVQYMKTTSSEHVVYINCSELSIKKQKKNNLCTQHVLSL